MMVGENTNQGEKKLRQPQRLPQYKGCENFYCKE